MGKDNTIILALMASLVAGSRASDAPKRPELPKQTDEIAETIAPTQQVAAAEEKKPLLLGRKLRFLCDHVGNGIVSNPFGREEYFTTNNSQISYTCFFYSSAEIVEATAISTTNYLSWKADGEKNPNLKVEWDPNRDTFFGTGKATLYVTIPSVVPNAGLSIRITNKDDGFSLEYIPFRYVETKEELLGCLEESKEMMQEKIDRKRQILSDPKLFRRELDKWNYDGHTFFTEPKLTDYLNREIAMMQTKYNSATAAVQRTVSRLFPE